MTASAGGAGDHQHSHPHRHDHTSTEPEHSHHASHRPASQQRLRWSIWLTGTMMVIEIIGGYWTGSLALLSDAVHMATHAGALLVSLTAIRMAAAPSDRTFPFGRFRIEVLAALFNGVTLLLCTGGIAWAAFHRMLTPVSVASVEMTIIAVVGLLVNLVTAWMLHPVQDGDLNTRSAFLHVLGDAASSVAVVLGGIGIWATGWTPLDPLLSVAIAVFILRWSWSLLRDAVHVLLERTPADVDVELVTATLRRSGIGILDVPDVRIWQITDGYRCAVARIVVGDMPLTQADLLRGQCVHTLTEQFGIHYALVQVELAR